jgi:anti-anti-sigma regulatory factor
MEIQKQEYTCMTVMLPAEPEMAAVLARTVEAIWNAEACEITLNFEHVDKIGSASMMNLIVLRRALMQKGGRLTIEGLTCTAGRRFMELGLHLDFQGTEMAREPGEGGSVLHTMN